jgi:CheY-like chemotaxis protein
MKAFKSWKPDLLVSDIGMPVEDGYSLITKPRKLKSKRAQEIPAVALTAYATTADQERTLSSGFQMHVAKPIDPEKLIRSIAKAMGSKL